MTTPLQRIIDHPEYTFLVKSPQHKTDTYRYFCVNGMERMFQLEEKAQGLVLRSPRYACSYKKIIFLLLLPLKTGGRVIKPALIHGDLGNRDAVSDFIGNESIHVHSIKSGVKTTLLTYY